jgi:hypothetical protein
VPVRTFVLWLLAGLTRPELNALALAAIGWELGRSPPDRLKNLRAASLGYLVPGALYFVGRWAHYGQLFPIPYYAKIAGGEALPGLSSAVAAVLEMVSSVGLLVAIGLLRRGARPIGAAVGLTVLLALLPDPVMNFDHRYAAPLFPALFAIAGAGLDLLRQLVPSGAAVSVVALLTFAASVGERTFSALRERRAYGEALERTLIRFGQVLGRFGLDPI